MKSVTSNLKTAIKEKPNLAILEIFYIYKQIGTIQTVYSSSTIWMDGDYTNNFSVDDYISILKFDYTADYKITSVSYNNTVTIITVDGTPFTVDYVNYEIAKRYDVNNRIIDGEVDSFSLSSEGSNLWDYDSGYLDVKLNNDDEYLRNYDSTGILDSNDIWWAKLFWKIKGYEDNILIFGGIIDLEDIKSYFFNKQIGVRVYGHSYELSSKPAYLVSQLSNELPKMPGIKIIKYLNSQYSTTGTKKIQYKPFENDKFKNIKILNVSEDYTSGMKIFEFKYPYWFRFDSGEWTKIATLSDTDKGKKKLYAKDTTLWAEIEFGTENDLYEYPDSDAILWVYLDIEQTNITVTDQGEPKLIYDDGLKTSIYPFFQRVLKSVKHLLTHSLLDITDQVSTPDICASGCAEALENSGEYIILISPYKFFGAKFLFSEMLQGTGVIKIQYSTGGDTFSSDMTVSADKLDDSTDNFIQDGTITWGDLYGWAVNDLVVDDTTDYKGYMIKIYRSGGTSSEKIMIKQIKNIIGCVGSDLDIIYVEADINIVGNKNLDDTVILTYENSEWNYRMWYYGTTLNQLLNKVLDELKYTIANKDIESIKVDGTKFYFNIWGETPKFNYSEKINSLFYDEVNQDIYLGLETEIWKSNIDGEWLKIGTVTLQNSAFSNPIIKIKYIWKVGNLIYVYNIYEHNKGETLVECQFGTIDVNTGTYTLINFLNECLTGEKCIRNGYKEKIGTSSDDRDIYSRRAGYYHGTEYGENIIMPFKQKTWVKNYDAFFAQYPKPGISKDADGNFPEWYYQLTEGGIADNAGKYYFSTMGFFSLSNNYDLTTEIEYANAGFSFTLGQLGIEILDTVNNDVYIFHKELKQNGTDKYDALISLKTGNKKGIESYKESIVPMCYAKNNNDIYYGIAEWTDEKGNNTTSSYIIHTIFGSYKVIDADKIWYYNGTAWTDKTNDFNTNSSSQTLNHDDYIYIGSSKKFRSISFVPSTHTTQFKFEYYDGVTWIELKQSSENEIKSDIITHEIQPDWVKTSVNGSASLYYIRIKNFYGNSETVTAIGINETVIWNSYDEAVNSQRYTPISMAYDSDNNVLHGSMFNRSEYGTYNIQWIYFVFDLNNETIYYQTLGSNFTYNGTYLLNNFMYHSTDKCVYYTGSDTRYKDKSGILFKGEYSSPGIITLTQLGIPNSGDYGFETGLISKGTETGIFGVTNNNILFEYSKKFYPRILLAKFSDSDTFSNVIKYITMMTLNIFTITSDRKIIFKNRTKYQATENINWDENLIDQNFNVKNYKHYYDGVKVNYTDNLNNLSGQMKQGDDSWQKKVLNISNSLIWNKHLADYISEINYNYFNKKRLWLSDIKILPLMYLEIFDSIKMNIPERIIKIDNNSEMIIKLLKYTKNKNLILSVLKNV